MTGTSGAGRGTGLARHRGMLPRVVLLLLVVAAPARADELHGNAEIAVALAGCDAGKPAPCLDAAAALDKAHVAERAGHTPRALRERAVALFEQQCTAGDADRCFEHGELLMHGQHKVVAADPARAMIQIERACTLHNGDACVIVASRAKQPARVRALLEQACHDSSARGCAALAEQLAQDDPVRSNELFRQACAADDSIACTRSGEQRRAAGDAPAAVADFTKACDLQQLASCDAAGALSPDPAGARKLFARACDAGVASGCAHLADAVAHGSGGERNWSEGIALAEKACTLAQKAPCAQAIELRQHPPDWRCNSQDECDRFCKEQIPQSCRRLAELSLAAPDATADSGDAAYENGCTLGDGPSCFALGNSAGAIEIAETWYQQACKRNVADACFYVQYAQALRGSATARELLRRRCGDNLEACVLYGLALEKHEPARAEQVWRDACGHGYGLACRHLAEALAPRTGYGTCDCDMNPPKKTRAELAAEAREAKRHAEGEPMWKHACELGDYLACQEVGPRIERAATVPAWE